MRNCRARNAEHTPEPVFVDVLRVHGMAKGRSGLVFARESISPYLHSHAKVCDDDGNAHDRE